MPHVALRLRRNSGLRNRIAAFELVQQRVPAHLGLPDAHGGQKRLLKSWRGRSDFVGDAPFKGLVARFQNQLRGPFGYSIRDIFQKRHCSNPGCFTICPVNNQCKGPNMDGTGAKMSRVAPLPSFRND